MNSIERVRQALSCMVLTPTEAQRLIAVINARTIPDEPMTERPSVSEAVDAVRAASYEIHDPGTPQNGLRIVHTVGLNNVGADMDLERVLTIVRVAGTNRLRWNTNRHDRHALIIDRGHYGAIAVEATRNGATR